MFLLIESLVLKLINYYVNLGLIGAFLILPFAIACIIIQFKRAKLANKFPWIIGFILLGICLELAFNSQELSDKIANILDRIENGTSKTSSASIFEPIFYILVGAKEKRVVIEEIIAFGFYTYLGWLLYFLKNAMKVATRPMISNNGNVRINHIFFHKGIGLIRLCSAINT